MNKSEQINELTVALAKAQSEIPIAEFDKVNPHYKSAYASLTSVMNAVRGPITKNGLSISHSINETEKGMSLGTTLFHTSGQFISFSVPLILDKNNMQGLGSAISYAKRYAVSAMLAVVSDEDDDGENAVGRDNKGNGEAKTKGQETSKKLAPVPGLMVDKNAPECCGKKTLRSRYPESRPEEKRKWWCTTCRAEFEPETKSSVASG